MTSIRHFPATHPLPDWRNFGVMLRVLLGVNLLALLAALIPWWPIPALAHQVLAWLMLFLDWCATWPVWPPVSVWPPWRPTLASVKNSPP